MQYLADGKWYPQGKYFVKKVAYQKLQSEKLLGGTHRLESAWRNQQYKSRKTESATWKQQSGNQQMVVASENASQKQQAGNRKAEASKEEPTMQ